MTQPTATGTSRVTADRAGGPVPSLDPGTCQVWWVGLDDVGTEHDALLGDDDRVRRSRLRLAADRQRLTAAWAVARLVLGAAAGVPPERLVVERRCPSCGAPHGKPWLPTAPDLQLSVAHSGGCAVVAVTWGAPIGVDVEGVVQPAPADLATLADATLGAEERAVLDRLPVEHRAEAFTTCWTRKEAVLKATGDGLTLPLDGLVVSPASCPPRLLRWPGPVGRVDRLSMHALHAPPGHVATLAVLGAAPFRVVEADAAPLLRHAAAG